MSGVMRAGFARTGKQVCDTSLFTVGEELRLIGFPYSDLLKLSLSRYSGVCTFSAPLSLSLSRG